MRRISVLAIAAACLLVRTVVGQAIPPAVPFDDSISEAEALDIAEATFRYQFQHNESGVQQKADGYFLLLFKKDPPEEFLNRFRTNSPPVRKGSEFKIGKGLRFSVTRMKRSTATSIAVSGGYYENGLSASLCTYTLVLIAKKWVVWSCELHCMS